MKEYLAILDTFSREGYEMYSQIIPASDWGIGRPRRTIWKDIGYLLPLKKSSPSSRSARKPSPRSFFSSLRTPLADELESQYFGRNFLAVFRG
jgi:hypothetical protein